METGSTSKARNQPFWYSKLILASGKKSYIGHIPVTIVVTSVKLVTRLSRNTVETEFRSMNGQHFLRTPTQPRVLQSIYCTSREWNMMPGGMIAVGRSVSGRSCARNI